MKLNKPELIDRISSVLEVLKSHSDKMQDLRTQIHVQVELIEKARIANDYADALQSDADEAKKQADLINEEVLALSISDGALEVVNEFSAALDAALQKNQAWDEVSKTVDQARIDKMFATLNKLETMLDDKRVSLQKKDEPIVLSKETALDTKSNELNSSINTLLKSRAMAQKDVAPNEPVKKQVAVKKRAKKEILSNEKSKADDILELTNIVEPGILVLTQPILQN